MNPKTHNQSMYHKRCIKAYERGCKDNKILKQKIEDLETKISDVGLITTDILQNGKQKILSAVLEDTVKINIDDINPVKNNTKNAITCSICYDNINKRCDMIKTPCNHKFHTHCYLKWCSKYKQSCDVPCPICRQSIEKKYVNMNLIKYVDYQFSTMTSGVLEELER